MQYLFKWEVSILAEYNNTNGATHHRLRICSGGPPHAYTLHLIKVAVGGGGGADFSVKGKGVSANLYDTF